MRRQEDLEGFRSTGKSAQCQNKKTSMKAVTLGLCDNSKILTYLGRACLMSRAPPDIFSTSWTCPTRICSSLRC